MARFNFTGKLAFNAIDDAKKPFVRIGNTKKGAQYKSLNASLSLPNKNKAFLELFGMKNDTVKTRDKDGNEIEFDWADRNDPEIVEGIAFYKKHIIDFGDSNRHEFVTALDTIDFIFEHRDELAGKIVTVTGNINRQYYKGKYADRFEIQNIYVVAEDTKQIFKVTMDFFWNKDGIDVANFGDESRVYIDGYTSEYDSETKSNKYMPRQIILDMSKIDWGNERHAAIAKFNLGAMGCAYAEGKVKANLGKGYFANRLICSYTNGAKEIEFDESQLTDFQKEQIELGLAELEDFRPRNGIRGEFVTEYKLVKFDSVAEYSEGRVKLDASDAEFEDDIYQPAVSNATLDEVTEPTKAQTVEVDDDDDELFG